MAINTRFCRYGAMIALPLAVGLAAFGATRFSGSLGPVADAPATIDLGRLDSQEFVDRDVPIRNTGLRDLVLSNFRGSCPSCLTFGLKSDTGLTDIGTLTVPPSGEVTISARMRVHGSPDRPFKAFVACDTNDPQRPELAIVFEAAIRGHIVPFPPTLDFGHLDPGQVARQRVELLDTGRDKLFRFGRVVCPDGVQAAFIAGSPKTGSPVGTVEVSVTAPAATWVLDGVVNVYEDGRDEPVAVLQVRGAVPPVAQVSPAAVVLPRAVGDGYDNTAECRFRSPKGLVVTVRPETVPSELVLTLLTAVGEDGLGYRIAWRATAGMAKAVTVRFRVEAGGRVEVIEVPVRYRPPT